MFAMVVPGTHTIKPKRRKPKRSPILQRCLRTSRSFVRSSRSVRALFQRIRRPHAERSESSAPDDPVRMRDLKEARQGKRKIEVLEEGHPDYVTQTHVAVGAHRSKGKVVAHAGSQQKTQG